MALFPTEFVIQGSPLDPTFKGKPQEFFEAMLERMKIVSPTGLSTFVTGSQKPTSNLGPWLKDGTQWWVWSDEEKTYIPLDISQSETIIYRIQETEPNDEDVASAVFWAQTDSDGKVINLYVKSGGSWYPLVPTGGGTSDRPSNPAEGQQFYDTDIDTWIYWRSNKWRTISGCPGDLKFVTHTTLSDALTRNPGWLEVGKSSLGADARGRVFISAHKNAGGGEAIAPQSGITARNAGTTFGSEDVVLTSEFVGKHEHWFGYNTTNDDFVLSASATNETVADKYGVRSFNGEGSGGYVGDWGTSVNVKTIGELTNYVDPDAHNNEQPSMALWCLVKEEI